MGKRFVSSTPQCNRLAVAFLELRGTGWLHNRWQWCLASLTQDLYSCHCFNDTSTLLTQRAPMRLSALSSVSILGWKRDAAHLVRFRVELEQCVVVKNPGPWVFCDSPIETERPVSFNLELKELVGQTSREIGGV